MTEKTRKKLIFATRNEGKIRELTALLAGLDIQVESLADYPDAPDVIEDGVTFQDNAVKKARAAAAFTGCMAVADDSGLMVDALDGRPGVFSARYAGEDATDENNIEKLLSALDGMPREKRGAAFRCVLVLYRPDGNCEAFEGVWKGKIADAPAGEGGFGYDPVFIVPEYGKTVAELPIELKNRLSHRAKAFKKLRERLADMTM